MKIDFEDVQKAKALWKKFDEFDKQWLSTRGVFNIMHKLGLLEDDDHKAITEEYDRIMAPVNRAQEKVKNKVYEGVSKFVWNYVVHDDDKSR